VVVHKSIFGVSVHSVCGAKVGFAEIFLMPQPPLLTRTHEEGNAHGPNSGAIHSQLLLQSKQRSRS
jgi:hypothetical protein